MVQSEICYFVPSDDYVEGHGYRAAVVRENEAGYHPTGTWPFTGKVGQTYPIFWGPTLAEAQKICETTNAAIGVSKERAIEIVISSMKKQGRHRRSR